MADEDAENVGGISVSVGADHSRLASDLAEANRQLDAWAKQRITVSVGADFTGGTGGGGSAPRQQQPTAPRFGAVVRGGAQGREQTAWQRAINEELAKTGQRYNAVTGEIEDMTAAVGRQRTVIAQVQQQAAEPTRLNIDTEALQTELKGILDTLREIAAEAARVGSAGGGGGRRGGGRRRAAAAGGDEEGEGGGTQGNRGGRVGIISQPRISEYEGGFRNQGGRVGIIRDVKSAEAIRIQRPMRVVVSPQQRAMEREAREAERQQRRAFGEYLASIDNTETHGGFAPQATEASRARDAAERQRQPLLPISEAQRVENSRRLRAQNEQMFRGRGMADEEEAARGGRGGGGGRGAAMDIEERERQRVASAKAQQVSAGRTARTGASSYIGSFLFGGGKERVEATAALAAANEQVAVAQRNLNEAERVGNPRSRRHAIEELTAAENQRAEALKRVESFSTIGAGARNLLAVTAAGAAFGLGLEAISVAAKAAERALTPYIDAASGYAQKTADFTTALADQARQQQGNAQGVTALKLAQSGYAQSTAASIQPVIANRVQIEAGNKALQEQIDTFRVAEALRKQGANTGLGGGTSGVLGTSLFAIPGTGEQTGNFLQGLGQTVRQRQAATDYHAPLEGSAKDLDAFLYSLPVIHNLADFASGPGGYTPIDPRQSMEAQLAEAQATQARGLAFLNDQLKQGGNAAAQFTVSLKEGDPRIERTAQAFDNISPEMATAVRELHLFSNGIKDTGEAISALKAINIAGTRSGPAEQLAQQQNAAYNAANSLPAIQAEQARQLQPFLASLERKQQVALGTQLPAQAALANLAAPPTPVGTGIVGRNAAEQAKIKSETRETQQLQDTLNAYYAKGYAVLKDTYQLPLPLLNNIQSVGQAIADTQAGIANEQAQYQVAQINYQLQISKRTLSDIGGLTGKNFGAGESYLGVLERQNLALSRQGQMLQFALSQRQINFQTAVAGFTVPGLTPAEQNARVEEAKIEASYAQKQLNIQREMFHNQVKIVDISNLRQGHDLARQIGLLLQGRKVTIDTALAQEKLQRLQATQAKLVAEAGTYISKVDAKIAQAEGNISQLEQAAGQSISDFEKRAVAAMFSVTSAFFGNIQTGFDSLMGGSSSPGGGPKSVSHRPKHASGALFSTQGTTSLGPYGIAGEAGRETVAILRNPHALAGMGGGQSAVVNFNGDMHFKTEADFQRLYRMVVTALGKDASIKGLRMPF